MNRYTMALLFACLSMASRSDETIVEEVIVSGFSEERASETHLSANSLSGDALEKHQQSSLGETLQHLPGIHSGSFGPGVGQPVIRGHAGSRVKVLQNSMLSFDAAAVSQDHANTVNPMLASRIEVIKGPSTLLYGNGAIGGVVNVIDKRIPESLDETLYQLELSHDTAASANNWLVSLDSSKGDFAWHIDASGVSGDDIRIPGEAFDEEALEQQESFVEALDDHDEEHHDEDEEHDDEHHDDDDHDDEGNSKGKLSNSFRDNASLAIGASWIQDKGFMGFSISHETMEYGIPAGGHAHHHGEEDHDEDDHEEEEHEDEHGEESISIDMETTRLQLRGEIALDSWLDSIQADISYDDYEHTEFEGDQAGSVFENRGFDSRIIFRQRTGEYLSSALALHHNASSFDVSGAEAYLPKTDSRNTGVALIESLDFENFKLEAGLRVDWVNIESNNRCKLNETNVSGSLSGLWRATETINILTAYNHAERSPSYEERYANTQARRCQLKTDPDDYVIHAATQRYELGNPNLENETSNSFELGLRKHHGKLTLEFSLYHQAINDYVYLQDIGLLDESFVSQWQQEDATFSGMEAEASYVFMTYGHPLTVSLFGDSVDAKFVGGSYIPRIPPNKAGINLELVVDNISLSAVYTSYSAQNKIGMNETSTDGFNRLDLFMDVTSQFGQAELVYFLKGKNLGNETIRQHTSLLKNVAPEPGRSIEAGLRFSF